jgi:conjugal transfer pilus assembly protein TraW
MTRSQPLVAVLAGTLVLGPARAEDVGTLGPTYPIAEPHLLRFIEGRLKEKERSGELQRLLVEARERGVRSVRQPVPVDGLQRTRTARSLHVDPTFTLERNIVDATGQVLFAAGTRANPLAVVSLSHDLLLFDGRDPAQVGYARALMDSEPGRIKPILTAGSYLDLMRRWQQPVYYDQQGRLVQRLGIRQVPARVSQDGLQLRVDELVLP